MNKDLSHLKLLGILHTIWGVLRTEDTESRRVLKTPLPSFPTRDDLLALAVRVERSVAWYRGVGKLAS